MARAEELAHDVGSGRRLAELAGRVRPTDLARDRRLPVLPALDGLLPASGLRRGTTAAIGAAPGVTGATSLALALAAGASQAGSWTAAVGLGSLGLVAAAEMGVAFERLVVVSCPAGPVMKSASQGRRWQGRSPEGLHQRIRGTRTQPAAGLAGDLAAGQPDRTPADPGRDRDGWASVVAALVDGFDVVLVAARPLRPADARRLVARVRERGAVLVAVGGELPGERSPLRLTVTSSRWEGLGEGWGHLRGRRVAVEAGGRGEAARGRRAELWLPGPDGRVTTVEPVAEPIPLRPRHRHRTGLTGHRA